MARSITIAGRNTIAKGFSIDESGDFVEVSVTLSGAKSDNACMLALRKTYGQDTLFLDKEVVEGDSVSLSADVFSLYSRNCVDGVSYGHATISRVCKETMIQFAVIQDGKPTKGTCFYDGETTLSKARKFVRDNYGNNAMLCGSPVVLERKRFMPKALFELLATGKRPDTETLDKYFAPYESHNVTDGE